MDPFNPRARIDSKRVHCDTARANVARFALSRTRDRQSTEPVPPSAVNGVVCLGPLWSLQLRDTRPDLKRDNGRRIVVVDPAAMVVCSAAPQMAILGR